MKILYIIHSLTIGGAETIVTNYLIQLKRAGQDVVLLQMFDENTFLNERLRQEKVRVLTACTGDRNSFFGRIVTIRNFRKLIREENPDIIHVHTGLEKFRYLKCPAERIVFTVHSEWKRCVDKGKNHRKMLFSLIKQGMSVITLSEKARRDVLEQFPDAKVHCIPNGLDFEKIRAVRYDREQFLESLNIPATAFVLGHVGRFHQVKNHEKVISVFRKVLEQRTDAHLLLVGSGNADEEDRVSRLIAESGVAERIHALGDRTDATAIMSVLDCFLLPSYSEAFPLVLVEAQVLGIRCVVSAAVPEEVCCNAECVQLSLEQTDDEWAAYVLGDQLVTKKNGLSRCRISKIIEQHLLLYGSLVNPKR